MSGTTTPRRADAGAAAQPRRLRFLTYNIHRCVGVDRRFRPERVIQIIAHHDPDVVLLQEVDDDVPRSRRLELGRELAVALGYPHRAIGYNARPRQGGRYGNATLSRFPIVYERNIDLTIGTKKPRGCQHTTLEVPPHEGGDGDCGSRRLEIFNLHLGLSAREREEQVGILVRSPEFTDVGDEVPMMVGGDFNDWRSRLRPIFTEVFSFDHATDRKTGPGQAIATYPSFSPRGPLDRFYVRGPLETVGTRVCRLRLSRVASDHLPVVGEFDLR